MFSNSQIVVSGVYVTLREYPGHVQPCLSTLTPDVVLVDLAHAPVPEVPPSENAPVAWLVDTRDRDAARAATRNRVVTIDVNATFSEVVDGLLEAVAGSGVEDLPSPVGAGRGRPDAQFSTWEREILGLLCSGRSNVEIAAHLDVSVTMIKTHVRIVYRKLGVATRSQAATWATQNGYAVVDDHHVRRT